MELLSDAVLYGSAIMLAPVGAVYANANTILAGLIYATAQMPWHR